MQAAARRRLTALVLVLAGLIAAVALALYGLRGNVTFFYSPSDIAGEEGQYEMPETRFRLGGLVKKGSIRRERETLYFTITDKASEIRVVYTGMPPDLFGEGQGVIASGYIREDGTFMAQRLLARHDEDYMPPELRNALERGGKRAGKAGAGEESS